jgi:uncharacterized tellurite resistance protein B-like protein
MNLELDTATMRRLRDALIAGGKLQATADVTDTPALDERALASIRRVEPFAETMFLMMMADGEAAETEKDAIRGALLLLTHGYIQPAVLDDIQHNCEAIVASQGVERRLQMIGARLSADKQDRETAFTLAAAVAVADATVASTESNLIDSIAEWYGISNRRRAEILQQLES